MKIAIFHTEFAYSGGAEKAIFGEMNGFLKLGHQVVCYAGYVNKKTSFPDEIIKYDVRQITPKFLNRFFPHDLIAVMAIFFMPFHCLGLKEYDIFLGENQIGSWFAFIVAKLLRKPYCTLQPYPSTITYPRKIDENAKRNSPVIQFVLSTFKVPIVYFDRLVIRQARIGLSYGRYAAIVLKKAHNRDFVNCESGSDLKPLRLQSDLVINGQIIKKPYVLITNRHFPAKRFEYAVHLLKYLSQNNYSNINLIITGSKTEYTEVVNSLAKDFGVLSKIQYTGYTSESDLRRLYSNALIYIYTSPEEDFGLGIVEAMACGIPVVAWDNAGPKYIIQSGKNGLLAKLGDMQDFSQKCLELIKNKSLYQKISINAKIRAQDFTWKKHVDTIAKQLQKCIR